MSAIHFGIREPSRTEVTEIVYGTETEWLETEADEPSLSAAMRAGFRRLAAAFRSRGVAMTSPVMTRVTPKGPFTVGFFIDKGAAAQPPDELPDGVTKVTWQPRRFAKARFGGYSIDRRAVDEMARDLNRASNGEDAVPDAYYVAVYDGPYQIFNRRNEVLVETTRDGEPKTA